MLKFSIPKLLPKEKKTNVANLIEIHYTHRNKTRSEIK